MQLPGKGWIEDFWRRRARRQAAPTPAVPTLDDIDNDPFNQCIVEMAIRDAEAANRGNHAGDHKYRAKEITDHFLSMVETFRQASRDQIVKWNIVRNAAREKLKPVNLERFEEAEKAKLGVLEGQYRNGIASALKAYLACLSDYKAFRTTNSISREPIYPASMGRCVGVALAIVVGEALFNSFSFSLGLDSGLIGGALQAITVAGINVAVSYAFGMSFRWLNVKGPARYWAMGLPVLFAAWVGGYNWTVGAYRTELELNPDDAAKNAILNMLDNPFVGMLDFNSLILIVVGAVSSLLAAFEGYNNDDPFPGYGKISRRLKAAQELVQAREEEYFGVIKSAKDKAIAALDNTVQSAAEAFDTYCHLTNEIKSLANRYASTVSHVALRGQQGLGAYLHTFRHTSVFPVTEPVMEAKTDLDNIPAKIDDVELPKDDDISNAANDLRKLPGSAETIKRDVNLMYSKYLQELLKYFDSLQSDPAASIKMADLNIGLNGTSNGNAGNTAGVDGGEQQKDLGAADPAGVPSQFVNGAANGTTPNGKIHKF